MKQLVESSGGENPYEIAKELGLEMTASSTVIKTGPRLEQSLNKLEELRDRYSRISLSDSGFWTNQNLSWARAVGDMIALADPIVRGGLAREESRGSHYRTDFLGRDDSRFLKTTVAEFDASTGRPRSVSRRSSAASSARVSATTPRRRSRRRKYPPPPPRTIPSSRRAFPIPTLTSPALAMCVRPATPRR
ncbi:MAG: hypothetical protein ACFHWZ_16385 [Phycisphaerales bacterium]